MNKLHYKKTDGIKLIYAKKTGEKGPWRKKHSGQEKKKEYENQYFGFSVILLK